VINIVLSPSQQAWNKCAMGDSEQDHTFLIAQRCAEYLKGYNANVCLIPKQDGTEIETLTKVCNISNEFIRNNGGTGFHLDIHTDGGYVGKGASGFYVSEAGKAFIMQIHKSISRITPWGDGEVYFRNLYVLNNTIAVAGLIEISFHDVLEQAKWIHVNMDSIAMAIVRGMEQTTGIVKIQDSPEHWAEQSYQKLIAAGRIINERRFDDALTRGEYFALEAQKI
jgi:N-acetylmuramoyl-L-alanine amidase